MANWKYIFRLIGILAIGGLLLNMTFQFKYSTFIFDELIFGILVFVGLVFFIWSIPIDIKGYHTSKNKLLLIPTGIGVAFIITIWLLNIRISTDFDKHTLLRISSYGDFNGTGIDFKTDGTFIFNNSAMGLNDYMYGEYKISGNQITLNTDILDNVVKTKYLEIRPKEIEFPDSMKIEGYVFQLDECGNVMINETEFRVVEDNRNE